MLEVDLGEAEDEMPLAVVRELRERSPQLLEGLVQKNERGKVQHSQLFSGLSEAPQQILCSHSLPRSSQGTPSVRKNETKGPDSLLAAAHTFCPIKQPI